MPRFTRRTFVSWLGAAAALVGMRRAAAAPTSRPADPATGQPAALPAATLLALAEAVLPTELGAGGTAAAARAFARWVDEYRPNAELLHPYGSDKVTYAGPPPLRAWRTQLSALDGEGRRRFGRPWTSLGITERQQVVRAALEGLKPGGMPDPVRAPHVALALMSHFFQSSEATDLCYGAQIGREQCRPLVHNGRQPLPLARGGKA